MRTLLAIALCLSSTLTAVGQQEEVFSGPQVGESLAPFPARYVYGEQAGQTFDLVAMANGGPLVIVVVHERTRPSIGLTRTVMNYATRDQNDGLTSGIVFLSSDATETETWLKRIRNSPAIPRGIPLGISPDGEAGPGAYGLNRHVTLTVLVANEGKVTANFPLVQPSIAADAPRIAAALAAVLGRDEQPTLADLGVEQGQGRGAGRMDDGRFRAMLSPVIQKTASDEQVDMAAAKVEELAARNAAFRTRVAEVANRIIAAGRIENYGTPHAQTYLRKWAREFGENDPEKAAEASE